MKRAGRVKDAAAVPSRKPHLVGYVCVTVQIAAAAGTISLGAEHARLAAQPQRPVVSVKVVVARFEDSGSAVLLQPLFDDFPDDFAKGHSYACQAMIMPASSCIAQPLANCTALPTGSRCVFDRRPDCTIRFITVSKN